MNERIKELARRAHVYADGHSLWCHAGDVEQFAKLIVGECIVGLKDNYPPDDLLPIEEVAGFLKEHFGVEE